MRVVLVTVLGVLSGVLSGWLSAVESTDPVVTINGEPITLRQLEDELLRKEGVQRLSEMILNQLEGLEWDQLQDDKLIIQVGDVELSRLQVAAELLKEDGPRVRREMINITLVRQALAKENIVVGEEILMEEFARQEAQFAEKLRERGDSVVPFSEYLRVSEEMSVAEYIQQEGFRMGAGLHELVHRRTDIPVQALEDHFNVFREERFVVKEAVELQTIYIPFRVLADEAGQPMLDGDGKVIIDPQHKIRLPKTMQQFYDDLKAGKREFDRTWMVFGRPYDPQAKYGKVGWIDRTGRRQTLGARRIPAPVVDRAFDADVGAGPALLPPIVHSEGVDLVQVLGRRPGKRPEFAAIRDQVRADYIEEHIDALTKQIMQDLGKEAEIDYGEVGLGRMTVDRLRQAGAVLPAE